MSEKEYAEAYYNMLSAIRSLPPMNHHEVLVSSEAVAILTVGKLQSDAIDQRDSDSYCVQITKPLGEAILDLDDIAFSKGLGPMDENASEAWDDLILKAEDETGRTADRRICL